jgi:uncharacterized membrane protein
MRIENTISIEAPVDRVWELTLDVESWPRHTPTMTAIERLDSSPLAVGSRARIKQPAQPTRVWTVTALEPGRRFAWTTRAMGTTMTGSHMLDPGPDGTTIQTLTVDIEGPLGRLVGALVRRPIAKALSAENEGFKQAAENPVARPPTA